MAKDATWINEQPYYEDDLELHNTINDIADVEWMEDVELLSTKKQVRVYEQDDTSIKSFKTTDYINGAESDADSIVTDLLPNHSAQGLARPSAYI